MNCVNGHRFCYLCNYDHQQGTPCSKAKPCNLFYDEPRTLRCTNCKLIIQDWLIHGPDTLLCYSCGSTIRTPKMVMISNLGYLLLFLFLPVLYPYIIVKYLACKGERISLLGMIRVKKEGKENIEWSSECVLIASFAVVMSIFLMVLIFWIAMPILPLAYLALILNFCKQRDVAKKLKKDFDS
ncbi:unnamed protein product [Moneuplotes crassus]|uniref:Uncharacterized protein n=1 Tax=Euplotes crassus TaxID=5936 RepID=A0AAD2D022_EUPCR|nr:unnamed protein product [Moneuplotes crassus]